MADLFVIAGAAGSGKTTFGAALAARLAITLLDLDEVTAPLVDRFRAGHPGLDEAAALTAVRDERYRELQRAAEGAVSAGGSAIVTAPFTAEIASPQRWRDWTAPFAGLAAVHLIWLAVTPEERLRRMRVRGSSRDERLIGGDVDASALPPPTPPVVEHLRLDALLAPTDQVQAALSHFDNASDSV